MTYPYDLIIVLGHEMNAAGIVDDETQNRLDEAYQLYSDGKTQNIMTMGWAYRDNTTLSLADAMAHYLKNQCDIPAKHIWANANSRDTVGDAWFSKEIYDKELLKTKKLAFVTSDYHQERARYIFDFIYGEGYIIDSFVASTDSGARKLQAEQASLQKFKETFSDAQKGDKKAISEILFSQHPLYKK